MPDNFDSMVQKEEGDFERIEEEKLAVEGNKKSDDKGGGN